ncbi:hypothetical protein VTK56DRAFT_4546 [Thermocarpiscus australiensis]
MSRTCRPFSRHYLALSLAGPRTVAPYCSLRRVFVRHGMSLRNSLDRVAGHPCDAGQPGTLPYPSRKQFDNASSDAVPVTAVTRLLKIERPSSKSTGPNWRSLPALTGRWTSNLQARELFGVCGPRVRVRLSRIFRSPDQLRMCFLSDGWLNGGTSSRKQCSRRRLTMDL